LSQNNLDKRARGSGEHQVGGGLVGEPDSAHASNPPDANGTLSGLRAAADTGDEQSFLAALGTVEWAEMIAVDFLLATRLALKAGAYLAARMISARGLERYPEDSELQKFARALAPPRVISAAVPPDPAVAANQEWLRAHGAEHSGKWVAVKNGELLGSADSLKQLVEQVGDTNGVLLTAAR
jgi:hypothetical protein